MSAGQHWFMRRSPASDAPAFFPPGQHPALEPYRRWLRALRVLQERSRILEVERGMEPGSLDSSEIAQAIHHLEERAAAFEEAESERKLRAEFDLRGGERF